SMFECMAYNQIYPLSLHDALPILAGAHRRQAIRGGMRPETESAPPRSVERLPRGGSGPCRTPGLPTLAGALDERVERRQHDEGQDRKSTRLNSSHVKNSYAVFCLE